MARSAMRRPPGLALAVLAASLLAACQPATAGVAPTAPPPAEVTAAPTVLGALLPPPTPYREATPAADAAEVIFWPEPGAALPQEGHFGFGGQITYVGAAGFIAHAVAFTLNPGEPLGDCTVRAIPTDRSFWADQQTFEPGQHTFQREFAYAEPQPGADRLVMRLNIIGLDDRLLYCSQQAYPLASGAPTPPLANFPTTAVTPLVATPTPVPPPIAWTTYTDPIQGFSFEYPAAYDNLLPGVCALRRDGDRLYAGAIGITSGPSGGLDLEAYAEQHMQQYGESFQVVSQDSARLAREPRGLIVEYFARGVNKTILAAFFQRGDTVYSLSTVLSRACMDENLGIVNPDVYYHIIESFRFTR